MTRPAFHPLLASSLLLLGLNGCVSGPDKVAADLDIPAAYRASTDGAREAWPTNTWWKGFNSPELNALIDQASRSSFDIAAAIARVYAGRRAGAHLRRRVAAGVERHRVRRSGEHIGFGTGSLFCPRAVRGTAARTCVLTRSG